MQELLEKHVGDAREEEEVFSPRKEGFEESLEQDILHTLADPRLTRTATVLSTTLRTTGTSKLVIILSAREPIHRLL